MENKESEFVLLRGALVIPKEVLFRAIKERKYKKSLINKIIKKFDKLEKHELIDDSGVYRLKISKFFSTYYIYYGMYRNITYIVDIIERWDMLKEI